MKKFKWYEIQFGLYVVCAVLFITWASIIDFQFNYDFIYLEKIFACIIGGLVTSGIIMILGDCFKK